MVHVIVNHLEDMELIP
ncbi:hypothetical protein VTH82DRAFT_1549 [Thermothelomyces myriococcoides]